ncbi:hypothetical protein I8748_16300 [Nostoc sp. CENA67]|uniref:Uncharacterized protein n=1 Tax=Amazonocrinis nigriterrae CENA67 TaxID=2794033 RepID=A0A8J7HU22_9NOST|nr:hypothetical protein [Amazonocrinis nigriterrae]MBH8563733.1 hypothetical protein [Amazonocrinis nigriterrae CENA67]
MKTIGYLSDRITLLVLLERMVSKLLLMAKSQKLMLMNYGKNYLIDLSEKPSDI